MSRSRRPPVWMENKPLEQPSRLVGVPRSNAACKFNDSRAAVDVIIKKLGRVVAELVFQHVDSDVQDWLEGGRLDTVLEMYRRWMEPSAQEIFIAQVSGENPTWQQLINAEPFNHTKTRHGVTEIFGFQALSRNQHISTPGSLARSTRVSSSINTESIDKFRTSLADPFDSNGSATIMNSTLYPVFAVQIVTIPLEFENKTISSTTKGELESVFKALTHAFFEIGCRLMLDPAPPTSSPLVPFSRPQQFQDATTHFPQLSGQQVFERNWELPRNLDLAREGFTVNFVRSSDKKRGWIVLRQFTSDISFQPSLTLDPSSSPFPLPVKNGFQNIDQREQGLCCAWNDGKAKGIVFGFWEKSKGGSEREVRLIFRGYGKATHNDDVFYKEGAERLDAWYQEIEDWANLGGTKDEPVENEMDAEVVE